MRVIFILAALGVLAACDRQSPSSSQAQQPQMRAGTPQARDARAGSAAGTVIRTHKGQKLPDVPLTTLEGKAVSLKTLAGRPVLVNLWATWCGPCVREMPSLARLADRQGHKIQVVPISQDLKAFTARDWWARQTLGPLVSWHDPKGMLIEAYRAPSLPVSIYYDASGHELWRVYGEVDWSSAEASHWLAEAGLQL